MPDFTESRSIRQLISHDNFNFEQNELFTLNNSKWGDYSFGPAQRTKSFNHSEVFHYASLLPAIGGASQLRRTTFTMRSRTLVGQLCKWVFGYHPLQGTSRPSLDLDPLDRVGDLVFGNELGSCSRSEFMQVANRSLVTNAQRTLAWRPTWAMSHSLQRRENFM
jgi:hypothetical protein